jgi:hypothetical protein
MTRSSIPLLAVRAVDAGFRVEVEEVYGVFTRALRGADRRRMCAYSSVREKQGLVPDPQLDDSHYELKGIRVGRRSRTNYSGGVRRSTGAARGAGAVKKKKRGDCDHDSS